MKKALILLSGFALLPGCASMTNWQPTVDSMGNPNANLQSDMADCKNLAGQASGGAVKETMIGAGVGGLLGGATGAALGAVMGNPGVGAAIGAAGAGIAGGAYNGISAEERYKSAYKNCLRGRGHKVL